MAERRGKRSGKRQAGEAERPFDPDKRVIAVTGAHSFIGAEVIKRLEENRRVARILAIDIRKPSFPLDRTQFYKVDLTLPTADADLAALLVREEVDTFVHAAFLSSPTHAASWAHELEDIGTMHVLNACAEAQVRKFVLASTTMVYGPNPLNPNFLSEDHPLKGHPKSPFINDKVGAEMQVRRFREENADTIVTVLRTALTIGPTVQNYATRFLSRPVAPVLMGYDPLIQFVHEQDAVQAFLLALDGDFPGEFNVVGDGVLPYSTVLAMMGKFPLPLPHFLAAPLARALWATQIADAPPGLLQFLRWICVADGAKAKKALGFAPQYDIKATIHDFLGLSENARAEAAAVAERA